MREVAFFCIVALRVNVREWGVEMRWGLVESDHWGSFWRPDNVGWGGV